VGNADKSGEHLSKSGERRINTLFFNPEYFWVLVWNLVSIGLGLTLVFFGSLVMDLMPDPNPNPKTQKNSNEIV